MGVGWVWQQGVLPQPGTMHLQHNTTQHSTAQQTDSAGDSGHSTGGFRAATCLFLALSQVGNIILGPRVARHACPAHLAPCHYHGDWKPAAEAQVLCWISQLLTSRQELYTSDHHARCFQAWLTLATDRRPVLQCSRSCLKYTNMPH
jgi:hypothetical protein